MLNLTMKTITAVELRKNMGEIFRRVRAGEQIAVTYRDQDPIILASQQHSEKVKKKRMAGLDALNAAPRKKFQFDPNKSYKELNDGLLREKYGRYM